ncbi:DNA recombination protein RmuC [Helicobacter pametensis]|uniref:DNA recombination protein RmuC n=1 Tax=Helicobacter pametensis TaxID=95149 RepID=UPI00054FECE3|nr:DNA recombination protein RmuC [Helicobacter pametensis]
MNLLLLFQIGSVLLLMLCILIWFSRQTLITKTQKQREQLALLELELSQKSQLLEEYKRDFCIQKEQIQAQYDQNLKRLEEKYDQNLIALKEEFTSQSTLHTNTLLAQNKNLLNEDSKKLLKEIFSPIQQQVKEYSERLTQNETSIQTSLKNMFEYSKNVEQNANKLAQILKGDKKIRGNFGEIQLKMLLEHSGLVEGEQYKLQENLRIEGSRYIPDAIVYLENHKSIIIDSKFSLPTDWDLHSHSPNAQAQIASNLKNRIDELAKKPYKDFDSNTYDFILLFIPYQNLLDLALESDPALYQYAYTQKIYLTTPHTLFMALKTIHITWIDIKRNQNAQKAFEEIGKFYDKFIGVVQNFEEIQTLINRLQKSQADLDNKLRSGHGNLLSRFEKLKELGAKTKKSIKAD